MTPDSPITVAAPSMQADLAIVEEWDAGLASANPLAFPGYGPPDEGGESVRTGAAVVGGRRVAVIECRFDILGGTMGAVAGERIVRAFARATDQRLPVVEYVASGGARLQEGMIALIQMARTASAAAVHGHAGLMSAAVLRAPTTGGVYASWASLSDVRAAAPGAVIGFGGPRVVAEVTGEWPPADSHTAESAYRNGLVDALVSPDGQAAWLAAAVGIGAGRPLALPPGRPGRPAEVPHGPSSGPAVGPGGAYLVLLRARDAARPSGLDWAAWLTSDWVELRGGDASIRAALATVAGQRCAVIAMDRHAFGDAAAKQGPGAFRLAQRAIRLADRLGLPVLTLIDTPGADPSPASEAAGLAGEIARTLLAMSQLRGVSVAVCVGEGGSGGAMALGHADRLLLLGGAVFSVIGPEAGAAVLYRDRARAPELTGALRVTAPDLLRLGVIDAVVPETVAAVRQAIALSFDQARAGDRLARAYQATATALRDGAAVIRLPTGIDRRREDEQRSRQCRRLSPRPVTTGSG
ncbi:MAG TPA: carboxyl transferase domain-containing protein [Trebonia sp.]|jgi:acetyl-CoA carboxylase carboxyl transferase subunit beta|nr:carboxyl transferase domain-containing protein [Trebonia sp.]